MHSEEVHLLCRAEADTRQFSPSENHQNKMMIHQGKGRDSNPAVSGRVTQTLLRSGRCQLAEWRDFCGGDQDHPHLGSQCL